MTDTSVATTILQQLGGRRFTAMTGAKNLVASQNGLTFAIGKNSSRANRVQIELLPSDTYRVTFARFAKLDWTPLRVFSDVYADQLQEIFTTETGLYTRF